MSFALSTPTEHSRSNILMDRQEFVYFLADEAMGAFVRAVDAHLEVERFDGLEADGTPPPAHYITTLYFDTAAREIARVCRHHGSDNVKLRAREYTDRDADDQAVQRERFLWLEIKARTGTRTRKIRFSIPSDEVGELLQDDGVITGTSVSHERPLWGAKAEPVLQEIAELCTQTDGDLRPDCIAHYRRMAWQDRARTMRVTLDTELAFFPAAPDMFRSRDALRGAVAKTPAARFDRNLVEVKVRGELPQWMQEVIVASKLEPAEREGRPFSKFLAASKAVHG